MRTRAGSRGFWFLINIKNGLLGFLFSTVLFIILHIQVHAQQYWQPVGPEFDRFIWSFYADTIDDLFYIGGEFDYIDAMRRRGITCWDGVSYHPLGCGVDWDCVPPPNSNFPHPVKAITRYNNEIVIAGSFGMVDGLVVNSIARWNGMEWDSLGNGLTGVSGNRGNLNCLLTEGNNLYVGGIFHIAGQDTVDGLAQWDGENWSKVGEFTDFTIIGDNNIYCMAYYKDELYIGGTYRDSLDLPQRIIRWDGTSWKGIGGGIVGTMSIVWNMVVYNDELYVGGSFTKANGNVGDHIQKWDGTTWTEVGGGTYRADGYSGAVRHFHVFNDELYVTGDFDHAGGIPASHIAKWNGQHWCNLNPSLNIPPMAIGSFREELFLGNTVFMIDSVYVPGLIRWTGGTYSDSCSTPQNIFDTKKRENGLSRSPNPANTILNISITEGILEIIEIYNLNGQRLLKQQSSKSEEAIDISYLPPGNYFIRAICNNEVFVRKFVVMR